MMPPLSSQISWYSFFWWEITCLKSPKSNMVLQDQLGNDDAPLCWSPHSPPPPHHHHTPASASVNWSIILYPSTQIEDRRMLTLFLEILSKLFLDVSDFCSERMSIAGINVWKYILLRYSGTDLLPKLWCPLQKGNNWRYGLKIRKGKAPFWQVLYFTLQILFLVSYIISRDTKSNRYVFDHALIGTETMSTALSGLHFNIVVAAQIW